MAIVSEHFGGMAIGTEATGFTSQWADGTLTVRGGNIKLGIIGAQTAQLAQSSKAKNAFSLDAAGSFSDGEILGLALFESGVIYGHQVRLFIRGSGSAGSENGYFVSLPNADLGYRVSLIKDVSGTATTLATWQPPHRGVANNILPRLYYWVRLRAVGTAIKAKVWLASDEEPAAWGAEVTDSSLTSGWAGIGTFTTFSNPKYVDYVAVATASETIPLPAGSGATYEQSPWSVRWAGHPKAAPPTGWILAQLNMHDQVFVRDLDTGGTAQGLLLKRDLENTGDPARLLTLWDDPGLLTDAEAVMEWTQDWGSGHTAMAAGVVLRYQDVGGVKKYYYAYVGPSARIYIYLIEEGVAATKLAETGSAFSWDSSAPHKARIKFRIEGDALKVKAWRPDTESEPAAWDVEITDSTLTAAGQTGLVSGSFTTGAWIHSLTVENLNAQSGGTPGYVIVNIIT